ncbi:MAG: carbohydrate kinase family protein [Deltaproteobacteria bacterium]|nr:carbohydrate kinase family protein [Deltaproteobacteria bacterium]
MKIFVSGSLAYDRIMDFPGKFSDYILPEKIHVLNVCFAVSGVIERFGGTAGNIAYGLVQLGEKPIIVAAAGRDFDIYRAHIKEQGLSDESIRLVPEELTAGAYITTDQLNNQITGFNMGAMKYSTAYDFSREDAKQSICIIAPGNLDDMKNYALSCRSSGLPYIFDPGQSLTAWSGPALVDALTGAAIFISNDYELEMTMKITGLTQEDIIARTGTVIVTMGENGSQVFNAKDRIAICPVPPDRVVDPTGAGDTYRAGLLKGLKEGMDTVDAARLGAVLASFAVEVQGTQEYRATRDTIGYRYEAAFGRALNW